MAEWREFGWVGRVALVGVLLSVGIAVTLGFSIPSSARGHLLDAQADIMENVALDLASQGLIPTDPTDQQGYEQFDREVRLRLLGGETVRVKVWTPDGRIAYSDASELVGRRFDLTAPALAAFGGDRSIHVSAATDPAHALEADLGELIEFYIPFSDAGRTVTGVFEVEQRVDALNTTLGHVRRNVWISIGTGIGVLMIFMGSLAIAGARALNRRRRQAETLLGDLLRAQEAERSRIVGALHDEVGQPLYRLLYGLEGSRAKVDDPELVAGELIRLEKIVREVDRTLRAELRLLHHGEVEAVGLGPALRELVDATKAETDIEIELDLALNGGPSPVPSTALFRAAQEGLINVRKHSDATTVSVRVWRDSSRAVLEIADNGIGARSPEGLGLTTTRERLDAIGGGLSLRLGSGGGTVLRAWVPLDEEAL
ncbi:MAG: sensor histidine kinase [Acidimicrobiia bacterium]